MAASKKLTQRDLVENYIKQIDAHFGDVGFSEAGPTNGLYALVGHLDRVLGEAQNAPPQGKADGSLDEQAWTKAHQVAVAGSALLWAVDAWSRR